MSDYAHGKHILAREEGEGLNKTRPNKNCWSQMQDDLACEVALIHQAVRARAIRIVQVFSVNQDQNFQVRDKMYPFKL